MGIREIKNALKMLEDEGNEKDVRRLRVAVPYKRGKSPIDRAKIIAYVAKNWNILKSDAEIERMFTGWRPGVVIQAQGHNANITEGSLTLIGDGSFLDAERRAFPNPGVLRWNEAQFVDGRGVMWPLDHWQDVATTILFGNRGSVRDDNHPWFSEDKRLPY